MKIASITAGAGGMICGSCLHDNTLARELIRQGHDVALLPLYTPIRTDEEDVSVGRVFYGAINVYLEQKSALFRHTPRALDRLLNNPRLLNWASRRGANSVDARDLGELTLSTLRGEEGNQQRELEELVRWLRDEYKPDVVHLSNSLMVGLARRIRAEAGAPVVCSLQGEDLFLDEMDDDYRRKAIELIAERARDVDGFLATGEYYARYMADYLGVDAARIHRVPLGIGIEDLAPLSSRAERPFTVGYLARQAPEKGLHVLLAAFRQLADVVDDARLRVAGYSGPKDRAYLEALQRDVREQGLAERVAFEGELDRGGKRDFLHGLDVLSVPTVYKEPKGLFVLEALACGVPVVQPDHGAFPEMIEATGGGLLVPPGDATALAEALAGLAADPARRAGLARAGRDGVLRHYTAETMARRTLEVYERYAGPVLASAPSRPPAG